MCGMCFQFPYEGGEWVWVHDKNLGAPERNGCIVAEGIRETHGVTPREKHSETRFTPEGVPVKIYTRVSSQTKEVAANAGPQIATL